MPVLHRGLNGQAFTARFMRERSWRHAKDETNLGKCAATAESCEKGVQYAPILNYRRE